MALGPGNAKTPGRTPIMRNVTLALVVFSIVGIFAESADAGLFRKRNRGRNDCNTCATPAAAAPVGSGCCGGAVAAGYSSYYLPDGTQAYYQPNGVLPAGYIPPTAMPTILPAGAAEVKIRLSDNSANPATLTIQPGTTVRWSNDGKNSRMVSSVKGDWKSDELAPGQEFTATFTQTGTFEYFCGSSRDVKEMKGTIVVK
ncbi:MAG: hypothetical protein C0467_14415 [Planctomycetaceae bacterium]|nr:hypothetical protein [Planctomycetaceae bacterium]